MVKPKLETLSLLAEQLDYILREPGGYSQEYIALKMGLHQSLISRALNGELKRETKRVRRLCQYVSSCYASMRKKQHVIPGDLEEALADYLSAGGATDILLKQLEILRLARSPLRRAELVDPQRSRG